MFAIRTTENKEKDTKMQLLFDLILWSPILIPLLPLLIIWGRERNFLWTRNPVGQMKFRDTGGALRLVHNVPDRDLDRRGYMIKMKRVKDPIERKFGAVYAGIPGNTRIKKFPNWKWIEWEQDPKTGKYILNPRTLPSIDSLYWQFPYGALMENVEIKGNIRANIKVQFVIWIAKPYTALGTNHEFLQLVIPKAIGAIGQLCGDRVFDDIKEFMAGGDREQEMRDAVLAGNGIVIGDDGEPDWDGDIDPLGYLEKAGVLITTVTIVEIESNAAEELEAKEKAELVGAATLATATAEANATRQRAKAEQYRLQRVALGEARAIKLKTAAQLARINAIKTALGDDAAALLISENLPSLLSLGGGGTLTTIGLKEKSPNP